MPTVSEMLTALPTSISTREQRIRDGSLVLVGDWMDERERGLHLKYRVPATVDLSAETTARTVAALSSKVALEVAEATAKANEWLASLGRGPVDVSPSNRELPREVVDYARSLCDQIERAEIPGLFIHGLPGRGKTAIAEHVLHHWQLDGRRGDKVAERGYLDAIKAAFDGVADEYDVKRRYMDADLLVLDDVGASRATDWALSEIEMLLDWRWTNGLPTVVTSNYDMAGLAGKWAAVDPVQAGRCSSRLSGMCADVHLTGPDHRPAVRVVPTEPGRHGYDF